MRYKSKLELDVFIMAAAQLRSDGLLQQVIAERLRISQPEVSRLLRLAEKDRGWLTSRPPRFDCPEAYREVLARARTKLFSSDRILEKLRALQPADVPPLRAVTVVHRNPDGTFGPSIVGGISELLARVDIAGVSWGRTISLLVSALGDYPPELPATRDPIRFIPLCGEPLKDRSDPLRYSASALALRLGAIFNGPRVAPQSPSLAGVPAFIPSAFRKTAEVETIRRFIRHVAGYASVFGEGDEPAQGEAPLIDRVEAILTSVGVPQGHFRGIFLRERVELGDLAERDLERWIVGDLGGILIPRDDLRKSQSGRVEEMNYRWTGMQRAHVERCAKKAAEGGRPGVIVLAMDRSRRDVVKRCVQLGLINELFIDQSLAEELVKGQGSEGLGDRK